MHILVIEANLEPSGGAPRGILEVCRALAARGHEVSLIHAREGSLLPQYDRFLSWRKLVSWPPGAPGPVRWAVRSLRVASAARPVDADVIYVHDPQGLQYSWMAAGVARAPLVVHLRIPASFSRRWVLGLPFVASAIAVSEATSDSYVRRGFASDRIEVIHNGVDLDVYRLKGNRADARRDLGIHPHAEVILYAGRIIKEKGIDVLVESFKRFAADRQDAVLLIGSPPQSIKGSDEAYVALLKRALEKEKVVWVRDCVDVIPLYEAADCVVVPSVWDEAFGRVVVEAMACERPVLASDVGGIPEILGSEWPSFLFAKGDVDGLHEKLIRQTGWRRSDPGLGHSLRKYVRDHFSLERQILQVERHLERAAARGFKIDPKAARTFRRVDPLA